MSSSKSKNADAELEELFGWKPSVDAESDDESETRAKVVDQYGDDNFDDDIRESDLRKRNVQLLDQIDERYAAKKVSRKDAYDSESDDELEESREDSSNADASSYIQSESEESNDGNTTKHGTSSENESEEEMSEGDESEEDEGDESEEDEGDEAPDRVDDETEEESKNFLRTSDTNVQGKIEKGLCVKNQLKMWENLLETRIRLQKCLVISNKMPQHESFKTFQADKSLAKPTRDATDRLGKLLDNLLDLQSSLLKNFPETKNLEKGTKKRKKDEVEESVKEDDSMDEEIPSDTEDEAEDSEKDQEKEEEIEETQQPMKKRKLEEYQLILQENHEKYKEYRDSVIHKWNDRTRITVSSTKKSSNQPILEQIKFTLGDRSKLRKRTQLKRSEYDIIGKEATKDDKDGRRVVEYDEEIFDDDDFYHQLLRELIEYKSAGVTDPVQLSRQWIQLQNMRRKMKRKIDTRATKGRRIRYNVHPKLVNFMAPVLINDTWTDVAKDELCSSLFSKTK